MAGKGNRVGDVQVTRKREKSENEQTTKGAEGEEAFNPEAANT